MNNLMARLERLERQAPDKRHVISYIVDIGEDPDEKQAEAMAAYKAAHATQPSDEYHFLCVTIVDAKEAAHAES